VAPSSEKQKTTLGGSEMIRGLHDIRRSAKKIVKLSEGDCELCGQPIGKSYCAPAQLIPVEWKEGLTLEVRYQVCCEECFIHIDAAINKRRELKNENV
jgi:hypothetical protein